MSKEVDDLMAAVAALTKAVDDATAALAANAHDPAAVEGAANQVTALTAKLTAAIPTAPPPAAPAAQAAVA